MERRKKESAIDLVRIENLFIAVGDETNLEQLLSAFISNKIITTKSSRHSIQSRIDNLNYLYGLDQYNGVFSSEFESFGQAVFVSTMYQRFSIVDQAPLNSNKVKGLIDVVVVNFGDKRFQDLNRDEQAALFVLQAAINNFSRVIVLTDPKDYELFIKYLNREGTYKTADGEKALAGTTEMNVRFEFAKKASANLALLLSDFSSSTMKEQRWETLKKFSNQKV